jgi:hypothetical protein
VTRPDLKPRTVGEILDAAFYVYRAQFVRLALVSLIASLPALVVATILAGDAAAAARNWYTAITESARTNRGDFEAALKDSMNAAYTLQPFAILSSVLQSIARATGVVTMCLVADAAVRRERAASVGAVLGAALPRLPAAIGVQIVADYFLGTCLGCCPPLGIVLLVFLCCAGAAIALERGPIETAARASLPAALRWAALPFAAALDGVVRSVRLHLNGPTLARGSMFVFFLLSFVGIVNLGAAALATIFVSTSGGWFWAQHYSEALIGPVWGLSIALWFHDLRVRREGADLAMPA